MRSGPRFLFPLDRLSAAKNGMMSGLIGLSGICSLYVGRQILVPLGLAAVTALVLSPAVSALRKTGIERSSAVIICVLVSSGAAGAFVLILESQYAELRRIVPRFHNNVTADSLLAVLNTPLPVWLAEAAGRALANWTSSVVLAVLATVFFVHVIDDLPASGARFADHIATRTTVNALGRSAHELGRRFCLQLVLDGCFGALIGLWLDGIGLPCPLLWALTSVLLRSVPVAGLPLAAACPLMLAAAVDATGWMVCVTVLAYLTADLIVCVCGQLIAVPRDLHLRPPIALISTLAWTAIWGLSGLILAMPLTLAIVILGRNFPSLAFLDVLLVRTNAPQTDFVEAMADITAAPLLPQVPTACSVEPGDAQEGVGYSLPLRPWNLESRGRTISPKAYPSSI